MKHCCIHLLVTVIDSYLPFSPYVWFDCNQDILDRKSQRIITQILHNKLFSGCEKILSIFPPSTSISIKSKSSLLYIMHSDFTVQIVHKRYARSYVTKNTNSYCRCWKTTRSIFSLFSPLKNDYFLSLQWAVTFAYFTSTSGLYLMVEGDEITWAFVTNYEMLTIFKDKGNY